MDGWTDGQRDGRCDFNMPPEVPSGALKNWVGGGGVEWMRAGVSEFFLL